MNTKMNTKIKLILAIIFACLFFNSSAQENSEKKNRIKFANKIIHSFGLQYNNVFHAKGKYEYRDAAAYQMAAHPCIFYGREYIVKYNFTYPSGFGVTTEFVAGHRDFLSSWWSVDPLGIFFDYTYYGGQIKVSFARANKCAIGTGN